MAVKHHVYLLTIHSEFRGCVKVEVAVLGSRPSSPYGLCGRKATFEEEDEGGAVHISPPGIAKG